MVGLGCIAGPFDETSRTTGYRAYSLPGSGRAGLPSPSRRNLILPVTVPVDEFGVYPGGLRLANRAKRPA